MPTLEFKGKQYVYRHHHAVPVRPLVPDTHRSLGPVSREGNLVIHGDNLHALKSLLPQYEGRIKCVYIDPPYNTGNNGWVYNDNVNSPLLQDWLQEHRGIDGTELARHDRWLCMMWPRLQLLRDLLSDNGVIFVSIDAIEHHHLRMLMDEIFGENNFIADIAVVSNLSGSSDQFGIAGTHEYCLTYAKDRSQVELGRFPVSDEGLAAWHWDETGYYKPELLRRGALTYSESLDYPIFVTPDGRLEVTDDDRPPVAGGPYTAVYPKMGNGNGIWRWSKRRIRENPSDVFAERRKDGSIAIYSKQRPLLGSYPSEKPKSVFYKTEYSSRAGGLSLAEVLPEVGRSFPYPKAVALITDILRIGAPGAEDIVLDSFAGSGTTAQALLTLNKEDGGNRRFILVECEDYADRITAERVRRVIEGVPNAREQVLRQGLDGSFTFCTLVESALSNPASEDLTSTVEEIDRVAVSSS